MSSKRIFIWSAVTCHRFGMRQLAAASTKGLYKSQLRKAATGRRTPDRFLRVVVSVVLICSTAIVTSAQLRRPVSNDSPDPAVEQRLTKLSQELRCLVCQNETLADSRADLAEDLREEIRIQIRAGKSDQEIIAFLTQRYGDFILYRPPVRPTTYLLWFGPFVLLLAGLAILFRYVKRRRDMIEEKPLSTADRAQVEKLLSSASRKETA